MSSVFAVFESACRDRLALLRHDHAQPIVGYVGNTVPVELITASGCTPLRIAPIDGGTALADRYVESISDPDVRWIFELYCSGALNGLAMLVIPRSSEAQHKLYLSLREAQRTGVANPGCPLLWLYDIPHTQRGSSHAYGLMRTQALWAALAGIGGTNCDDEALRDAIQQGNRIRMLLRAVHEQRWHEPLSGRQALVATSALRFMTQADGEQALRRWIDDHGPAKLDNAAPRLLVRGVPLDHDALHGLVESLGATIVAEDDDWGARGGEPLIAEALPALQAVFEHYWRDVPCPRIHPARDDWFKAAIGRPGLDGVLFYLPRPDDVYGWSFPADRDLTRELRLPSLLIRDDARQPDALRAALQTFIASLHHVHA